MPAAVTPRRFLPVIRRGTTRTVLVLGPVALKLALGERGRRCNRFEAGLYKRVNPSRRAMLCPVLWCTPTGWVLIARAANPLTEPERDHLMKTGGFPDWDYLPPNDEGHPFEYKASDWGWLDGDLVALDCSASVLCEEPHPDMKKWN
jgi:hypothetical protein